MLLLFLCNFLAVLVSDAQNAAVKDQLSVSSACPDMNFFNTVVMKGSVLILHITLKIVNGRVKNSAKVATTLAKLATDPKKINARLAVLMVLVDKLLIEFQLLENVFALLKWQK